MTTLQAQIPDLLLQEVRELASQQNASVDQIVSVALASRCPLRASRERGFRTAGRLGESG